jgi:hypothetical protein
MVVTGAEWKSPVDPGDRGFCQTEVRGTCVFAVVERQPHETDDY